MLEDRTNRMEERIMVDTGQPSSETTRVESERARWLNRLGGELVKLDELFPEELGVGRLLDEACPAWEEKVAGEIARILMPGAELKGTTKFTPKQMGAILGHQCANGVWMVELFRSAGGCRIEYQAEVGKRCRYRKRKSIFREVFRVVFGIAAHGKAFALLLCGSTL